ncbi:uncharacterized protein LOC131943836 [Physella acuta]|uniref:uncharacterized protein LOC131943836 n=1 Tax=Physella acuta TaxID=109671 RepID=UPI0027DC7D64|nr:uncharacterized protein LOC131943836 [Physella acuta]
MRSIMKLFFLFFYLQISESERNTYPVEINTIHEFEVNTSACDTYAKLEVLCEALAYCMVPSVNNAICNKTKHGVQMLIPLRLRCDKMTIKCADNVVYERNLVKYKIPKDLKSSYNITDDRFLLTTKAIGIYPGGVCKFHFINMDNSEVIVSSVDATADNKADIHDVTCNFSLPTTTLARGYYEVNISVYPSTLSLLYGRNDSRRLFIGLAVSLINCQHEYTYVNKTINCTCVRSDNYQITAQPMWYNNRHEIQGSGSSTLSIQASNCNNDYYCVAQLHNISSSKLRYSITFQEAHEPSHCCFNTKEITVFASSMSGTVLLFAIILFCVVTHYKHRLQKHHQFTETSIPGDHGLYITPLDNLEDHRSSSEIENANLQCYHNINEMDPASMGSHGHHYSEVGLPGHMSLTGDPPMSSRLVEPVVTQNIQELNDGYLTPLDVDTQTTGTTNQRSQQLDGYAIIIDHYSTID